MSYKTYCANCEQKKLERIELEEEDREKESGNGRENSFKQTLKVK